MRHKRCRQALIFRAPKHRAEQPVLLPASLEDLVPEGHLARSLKEIVGSLDLSGIEALYDDKGGYPYDPHAMLGVLLFGLIDGERSSRRIQEHCRFDARYRYLCGAHVPDDRTICRFRRRLEGVLPELFSQVLSLSREKGLVKMHVVAVDGTKVEGNVQQWRRILSAAEAKDASDPDCRTMKARSGRHINGYNAQAAVDAQTGIVLAADVSQCASDFGELRNVVEQVGRNTGRAPEAVVADKGYDSAENASFLESENITPYLYPRKQGADFWQVAQGDRIVCPEGHALRYRDRFERYGKRTLRLFIKECPSCPKKAGCHESRFKQLSFPEEIDPRARIRNAHRCRSPEGKAVLALRGISVETLFAQLKWNQGLRRFRLRGLSAVRSEFLLECLAHNLRKVARPVFWRILRQTRACSPVPGRQRPSLRLAIANAA